MILIVDNYDSFTYNLATYFNILGEKTEVRLNDSLSVKDIIEMRPEAVVVSPGPKRPEDSELTIEVFRTLRGKLPILGVCLGHQAFAHTLGLQIIEGTRPMHGKITPITHDGLGLYTGLPSPLRVMRYHSLVVDSSSFSGDALGAVKVTAQTADGVIMGLRDEANRIETVQFHPESIGTEHGLKMIENFLHGIRQHS